MSHLLLLFLNFHQSPFLFVFVFIKNLFLFFKFIELYYIYCIIKKFLLILFFDQVNSDFRFSKFLLLGCLAYSTLYCTWLFFCSVCIMEQWILILFTFVLIQYHFILQKNCVNLPRYSLNTLWFKFLISLAVCKILDDWIDIKFSWILGMTVY